MSFKSTKLKISQNVSLKNFSTFKIGGKAKYFILVKSSSQFLEALKWANKNHLNCKVFGGATNVVFGNGVLNYLFIRFLGGKIQVLKKSFLVDGGVPLSLVVKLAVKNGLQGLENLTGIPGTVAGAVVGNAGAFGHSISEVVDKVEVWDGKKKFWMNKERCKFDYRESVFKSQPFFILRVKLSFKKGNPQEIKSIYRRILAFRKKKYPSTLKCAGSFFKNPLLKDVPLKARTYIDPQKIIDGKIPAGYLLEKVGVKGKTFGKIKIADFHANLLINRGGASSSDIHYVSRLLQQKVKKKFGILLEEEVRYLE